MPKTTRKPGRTATVMTQDEGEQAIAALQPELERLTRPELVPVRVDMQRASAFAHSVAVRDSTSPRVERLMKFARQDDLPEDFLERVREIALATWYARLRQQRASAVASGAVVPVNVVRDAQTVRGRMLRALEYYFEDDATLAARLADIRSGSGLQDLANDLTSLAEIYVEPSVRDVLAQDTKHYHADDPATARQLAKAIFSGLGLQADGEAAHWGDLAQRAWTLLFRAYEDLRSLGQFVFRRDEDVSLTYPSLVSAIRSPGSPSTVEEPPEPDPDPPVEPPPPDPTTPPTPPPPLPDPADG